MNKAQRKILFLKILPKFILIAIIFIGILTYIFLPAYLRKKNDDWYNNPKNQEKIRKILDEKNV